VARASAALPRVPTSHSTHFDDAAIEVELAGVAKYGLPVAYHVLVESNAWPSLGQNHLKPDLAALKRIRSEIVAVQFDQVEGVQEYAFVTMAVADEIERSDAGQPTASPSMMQDRERRRANVSTISGKR
jgi:hypothetical protein